MPGVLVHSKSLNILMGKWGLSLELSKDYFMEQDSDVYMSILLRTMPDCYKKHVSYKLPEFVEVPKNEIFLVAKRNTNQIVVLHSLPPKHVNR